MLQIKLEQAGIATSLGSSSSSSAAGSGGGGAGGGAGANALGGLSSTVDPKGYLTGLDSQMLKSASEIGCAFISYFLLLFDCPTDLVLVDSSDIKRARALLQSLIKTNPKHAPGWVAAAWLENVAGKQVAARKIIAQGCEECPKNEDVWIAASELNVGQLGFHSITIAKLIE